ncbi:MAG: DnaJ domain-containing protein [Nitrospiraceae bacterium]
MLGIPRSASADDIRRPFDVVRANTIPTSMLGLKSRRWREIKELNEAHEILSDPDKRKKYDQYGHNWENAEAYERARQQAGAQPGWAGTGAAGGGGFGGSGGDFGDIFETFFGGRSRGSSTGFPVDGEETWKPTLSSPSAIS